MKIKLQKKLKKKKTTMTGQFAFKVHSKFKKLEKSAKRNGYDIPLMVREYYEALVTKASK